MPGPASLTPAHPDSPRAAAGSKYQRHGGTGVHCPDPSSGPCGAPQVLGLPPAGSGRVGLIIFVLWVLVKGNCVQYIYVEKMKEMKGKIEKRENYKKIYEEFIGDLSCLNIQYSIPKLTVLKVYLQNEVSGNYLS